MALESPATKPFTIPEPVFDKNRGGDNAGQIALADELKRKNEELTKQRLKEIQEKLEETARDNKRHTDQVRNGKWR